VLPSTVQLEVGPVADVPVRLDPGQFDQLLLNLVINARDAMPEGGTLRISVTAEAAHGAADPEWAARNPLYAVLRVSDTGVGIDPAITARLFEPFFSTKGARGTGLGLAVVAEIVDRFGGAIHVESRLGAGTTFEVTLPAEPTEE
jgi:signal transduction histidine kinase